MFRTMLVAICALLLACWCGAEPVFIQAEDLACDGKAWVARDQTDRYAPDSRGRHLWGARGGEGLATTDLELPDAGTYRIWVRHTVTRAGTSGARGPFMLQLKRGDEVLAEGRFDEQPPENEPRRVHAYVWTSFDAELPAGALRLELSKLDPLTCSGYTRYVDCFVLSSDLEYVPRMTDMQPKVWLRVTLGATETPPIYIHCFADHFRAPWYKHFSLSRDGYEEGVRPTRREQAYLTAGEATPWCDITPAIHEDSGARLELRGAEKYSYDEWLPALDATFDFATAPEDAAIVKSFHREGPGAGLVIMVPGVLSAATGEQLKADVDFVAELEALAKTIPAVEFGRRPERFPFFLSLRVRPWLFRSGIAEAEYSAAAQVGFNGSYDHDQPVLKQFGFTHTRARSGAWYMANGCYLQPQIEKTRERVARNATHWPDPPTLVMTMDEPSAKPLAHAASCERCRVVFRAWLREEMAVPLADLGPGSWETMAPVTGAERDESPALYYWSQRFRAKAFADFLRLQTETAEELFPGSPPVTVNFSDGAIYSANMYLGGADYFHIFESRALTMAWSEDWSNIASTYQCAGFNVDLLRAASKRHDQQIGMYVITSYGRTPLDVKLKAYSSLGRGVRVLHSFSYGPEYGGHEPGWYLQENMYHPMAQLTHEIGGAEDLLLQAGREQSEVAFLYSTTSDIWTIGVDNLPGFDRMHTYLALMHAQVPVDFVSEEDVAGGELSGYKALYVFGPNLHSSAAGAISDWVRAGGTMYLAGGAAVADEYNRPARPLDDALGLTRGEPATLHTHNAAGRYMGNLQAAGMVAAGGGEIELLGMRQEVSGGETLAWDDAGPLAARVACGEGTVFACGFAPGLSYIHRALAARDAAGSPAPDPDSPLVFDTMGSWSNVKPGEMSYNPWQYPEVEREFLLEPVRHAGVVRPVELNRPLVEAFYLTGEQGAVVTLANYSLQPIEKLSVTVRAGRVPAKLESVRHGPLRFAAEDGTLVTEVPLLDTDMLKLYW